MLSLLLLLTLLCGQTSACRIDDECDFLHICNSDNTCEHKKLFQPFTTYEAIMVFIIFIVSGLFNATGIGGGSLFVAYLISVLKYETKTSIGISYAILFGGSLAKTSFSIRLRNEES